MNGINQEASRISLMGLKHQWGFVYIPSQIPLFIQCKNNIYN